MCAPYCRNNLHWNIYIGRGVVSSADSMLGKAGIAIAMPLSEGENVALLE